MILGEWGRLGITYSFFFSGVWWFWPLFFSGVWLFLHNYRHEWASEALSKCGGSGDSELTGRLAGSQARRPAGRLQAGWLGRLPHWQADSGADWLAGWLLGT